MAGASPRALAALLALAAAGCSTSYQLGALGGADMAKADMAKADLAKAESTGTVTPSLLAASFDPAAGDLALIKAAATTLMASASQDTSALWENPRSGARGMVTPIAAAATLQGLACRDFLASRVRGEQESWYQGSACREGRKWEVRALRPLQRT